MSARQLVSIVDDDKSVRTATEGLIRSLGFAACGFESAESFLSSPRVAETACLISDVQMPGMDGLELQSRMQAQGLRVPTIFVTAFPKPSVTQRAAAAGALAVLEKPFDGATMVRLVTEALEQSGG